MELSAQVTKFTGENWNLWKFQVQVVLKSRGLWDIVSGVSKKPVENAEEWVKKDAKAQEIIVVRMEEKPLTHILACQTAAEMWLKLKTVYEHQSQVSVHLLQQKFFKLEYNRGGVAEFISQIEEIQSNLKQRGEEISDKMVITKILMSLPEDLKHFVSAWESTPSDNQTLTELFSRLMIEEERNRNTEQVTALTMRTKDIKRQKGVKCFECNTVGHVKKNCPQLKPNEGRKTCHYCKKDGHLMKDCWFKKRKDENMERKNSKSSTSSSSTQALVGISSVLNCTNINTLIKESHSTGDEWWLDSGATEHMCFYKDKFYELRNLEQKKQVKVGNGEMLDVQGIGKVKLNAWNGKEWLKTELNNVLFVPELKVNLFSLSTVLDKGFEMRSDREMCKLLDKDGQIRAVAKRDGKLFRMTFKNSSISQCNIAETLTEWHRKLAHVNFEQVKKTLKMHNIKYIEEESPFCQDCLAGKQHRLPFPSSESRAKKTGELIHGDLCGPFEVTSLGEAKYFLMLKDDFSWFRFVYFVKNKSEVKQIIEKFFQLVENQTGNKIVTLRTDNGLEFINKDLADLTERKGIRHERSCTYCPKQNGRAEREMRTLVEAARTLLHCKSLDKMLWAEAINTAVFVLNRVGSGPQKDQTPYKLWYEKESKLSFFKEFGSKVSVHVPKEKRLKLDAKNQIGIFVGYSETVKGYRIYFLDKNKVEIHRDVVFIPQESVLKDNKKERTERVISLDLEIHDDEQICQNLDHSNSEAIERINSETEITDGSIESTDSVFDFEEESDEDSNHSSREQQMDRTRRITRKPIWTKDYDMNMDISFFSIMEDPITYEEAVSSENADKWKEAMDRELKVLRENNTWCEVQRPVNKKVIESKWVFKQKSENEFKARIVARGFQ